MPLRNMYLQSPDSSMDLIVPMGLNNPENNLFDKSFNPEMDMNEWDEWMRWEGGMVDLEAPIPERKESSSSSASSPEFWSTRIESVGRDPASTSFVTGGPNTFQFEDAPYELEETSQSCNSRPLGLNSALYSTRSQTPQGVRRSFRGISSLTEAEERSLQEIAMPYRMLAQVKISESPSPTASNFNSSGSQSPSPEPETFTRTRKKRKSATDDEAPNALCQSRKRGHNAIEKRYRTNLNEKINCLRAGVPDLCKASSLESKSGDEEDDSDTEGVDGKAGQQKYGKAAILTRALEYIQHLETATQRLGGEVDSLKTRVGAFEKLAMSGSIGNRSVMPSADLSVKSETLESIQVDFQQIQPKFNKASVASPTTKKRNSKQGSKKQ